MYAIRSYYVVVFNKKFLSYTDLMDIHRKYGLVILPKHIIRLENITEEQASELVEELNDDYSIGIRTYKDYEYEYWRRPFSDPIESLKSLLRINNIVLKSEYDATPIYGNKQGETVESYNFV